MISEFEFTNLDFGKIIINIKDIMINKNISVYSLSKKTGIKYHLIKKYYNQDLYRVDLTNLAKICYALECDIDDIIDYIPPKKTVMN